ncbi:MAG: EAL domain-containing protein [Pseudomonadota bacterium]
MTNLACAISDQEAERIRELYRYEVLDTPADAELDRIVQLVAVILDVPVALLSLLDVKRQWFKASVGLDVSETPRDVSFCVHMVCSDLDSLVVNDATTDARFADNPLVVGPPGVRFYAGVPLVTPAGHRLGSLCVVDMKPRPQGVAPDQMTLLKTLAATVMALLDSRRADRESREAKQRLDQMATRFEGFAHIAADWFWEQDKDYRFTYLSPELKTICGLDPEMFVGKTRWENLNWPPTDPHWRRLRSVCEAHQPFRDYRYSIAINGKEHHFSVSGIPLLSETREFEGYRGVGRDITEETELTAQIAYLAAHDSLTGLLNRTGFEQRCERHFRRGIDAKRRAALLLIDIDRFKNVNDTLGHAAGDRLLRTVAERLRAVARDNDVIARLGADEIAVLQSDVKTPQQAAAFAQRIRETLAEPYQLDDKEFGCTVSIGVAVCPDDGLNAEELLRNAHIALDRAKEFGRDSVHFFKREFDVQVRYRRQLESDLQQAVGSNEFVLYYQPQIDLRSNRCIGYEALIRWQHPERGLLPPSEFIPPAEESGLIVQIGQWVVQQACMDATRWPEDTKVAVNMSAAQFHEPNLVEIVERALDLSGLPPKRLELEITETTLMENCVNVTAALERWRQHGISIAMDDFGSGYSSLNTLWRFPFDKLKVDRDFVMNIGEDPRILDILATIIGMAKTLRLVVVAEGIETENQLKALKKLECDQVQGFYLGKPDVVENVINSSSRMVPRVKNEIASPTGSNQKSRVRPRSEAPQRVPTYGVNQLATANPQA